MGAKHGCRDAAKRLPKPRAMARQARLSVAGLPHYVVWRGLASTPVFRDDEDLQRFLQILTEVALQHEVLLHAYLLLDEAVHLLLTPRAPTALSLMMQGLGRRYVRLFNLKHGRQGTLWAGRYRCTLIEPGESEIALMAMLDTEPVHHKLADAPDRYPWSSHAHYLGRRQTPGLVAPAAYWLLGNTPFAREAAYAQRVAQGLSPKARARLQEAALTGWVLGSEAFIAQVQKLTGRRVVKARPGRPRSAPAK